MPTNASRGARSIEAHATRGLWWRDETATGVGQWWLLEAMPLTVDPAELAADSAALLTELPWVPAVPLPVVVVDVCTVLRPPDAMALTHWPCAPGGEVGHVCAALETLSPWESLLLFVPLVVVDDVVVVCATVATQSPCASAGVVGQELAAFDTVVPWTAPAA